MGIQIIDYNGASPYAKTVTANKVKQVCEDFQDTVMKCTGTTTQKAAIYSDALMSYASPQTGEAVNIYRAVSEENVSQLSELEGNFNTKYYDLLSNRYKSNTILEYARLYLDGTMQMWIDAKDSIKVW